MLKGGWTLHELVKVNKGINKLIKCLRDIWMFSSILSKNEDTIPQFQNLVY